MTVLGKMLVFLVLLLSLVWNGLVVNAYVTRSNWKVEAEKYQSKAKEAASSANELRRLIDLEREASDNALRIVRQDRDRLYGQLADLEKQNNDLNKAYQEKLEAEKQIGNTQILLQANLKSLNEQVDSLTNSLGDKEKAIDQLTLTAEQAKAAETNAKLEAEAQRLRADRFNERIIALTEQIEEVRRGGMDGGGVGREPRASAPVGFRGTVRARQGELVSFTPGLDAGLQKNTTLTVFRLTPAPKYLGKIQVIQVDPKEAVGRFIPPSGVRLGADDYPKAGDELKAD